MNNIPGIELYSDDIDTLHQIGHIKTYNGNFQTMKKEVGEEKMKSLLTSLYPKYNITEIEDIMGISDSTLARWFNELEIPFIAHRISNKAFAGDKNKFEIVNENGVVYKKNTVNITPELAYLIGFTLGDGAVQKYMVEVFNKDLGPKQHLYETMKPFGAVNEDKTSSGIWRLRLSSVLISNLIKENKKIRKDTIDYIFEKDKLAKKFIAAFWDAEGSVLKQGNYFHIYLYNSNKKLLDKIRNFLIDKGIESSIISIDGRGRKYSLNGRPVIAKKIIYRLGIPKKSLNKWTKEIGKHLLHYKKSKIIKIINDNGVILNG